MREVALPSGAEIRVPPSAIFVRDEARSRAIAVASKSPFAFLTLPCEAFALVLPKLSLFRAVNHLGERFLVQIAELKFREYIVVASIDIAIMFHRRGVSAGSAMVHRLPGTPIHPASVASKSCTKKVPTSGAPTRRKGRREIRPRPRAPH